MLKTPKDFKFAQDTTVLEVKPYLIHENDWLEMHIFSNDGFRLVDVTSTNITSSASSEGITYLVEENGAVKLPVIGRVPLKGMSIKEAENFLQEKYSVYYKDPFVILRVVSRQAIVFMNDGGKGSVIHLENDHTTLFEALALAGGITDYSKANSIKIIRGNIKNPEVFMADVSTIEGLKNSTLQVYPNDIIYIDSGSNLRKRITTEIVPYISLLTSFLVLLAYFNK
jgi:polysaccharide export outer membrane protein